jgi:hypothetical protein
MGMLEKCCMMKRLLRIAIICLVLADSRHCVKHFSIFSLYKDSWIIVTVIQIRKWGEGI